LSNQQEGGGGGGPPVEENGLTILAKRVDWDLRKVQKDVQTLGELMDHVLKRLDRLEGRGEMEQEEE
jgi:hypothetical protein